MSRERFDRLSPEKKKVLIAKDALKWLVSGHIRLQNGVYMNNYSNCRLGASATSKSTLAAFKRRPCHVCAKGGLFFTAIMRTNEKTVKQLFEIGNDEDSIIREFGQDVFPQKEWDTIEMAFEGWKGSGDKFSKYFDRDSNQVFIAICVNIILNKGHFKISVNKDEFREQVLKYVKYRPALKAYFKTSSEEEKEY